MESTSKWMDELDWSDYFDDFEERLELELRKLQSNYLTTGSSSSGFEEIDVRESKRVAESEWRRGKYLPYVEDENGHISILLRYISNLSTTCHFRELPLLLTHPPSRPLLLKKNNWRGPSMIEQYVKEIFVVPRLKKFHENQNRIHKSHLVKAFLSLLLQLLYHKTDQVVDRCEDGIENLEKELRFLLTILGDVCWMLLDRDVHDAEFQNLLSQFEAVANEAGSFVHYLFFSKDRAMEKTNKWLAAVLKLAYLMKAKLQSSVSIQSYTTPMTSIVNSILILDSLVGDLEDLLKREDDPIADNRVQFIELVYVKMA